MSRDSGSAAAMAHSAHRRAAFPRWAGALLRVPLVGKLAGANAVVVLAALGVALAVYGSPPHGSQLTLMLGFALGGSVLVNMVLVVIALRPLRHLESTAERIWRGDFGARVPDSLLADRDMARVGDALNELLDGLTADRARVRQLASDVIRAGDRERSAIARELHDSAAQSLAALLFQVSVAERECDDPALAERLRTIKQITTDVLEEVRMLAHTVHPRVLDDLGLVAALRNLVRKAEERTSAEIALVTRAVPADISHTLGSVLYRVAQEALNNALKHADPSSVTLTLVGEAQRLWLEVADDGRGFDVVEAERRRPGMGLFTMRERVALVDGRFELTSVPGKGTRVHAEVPLENRESE